MPECLLDQHLNMVLVTGVGSSSNCVKTHILGPTSLQLHRLPTGSMQPPVLPAPQCTAHVTREFYTHLSQRYLLSVTERRC